MLDIKEIIKNPQFYAERMQSRGVELDVPELARLYSERNVNTTSRDEKKAERKRLSNKIRLENDITNRQTLVEQSRQLSDEIQSLDKTVIQLESELQEKIAMLPNLPFKDVPVGDKDKNRVVRSYDQKREFGFEPKNHLELAELHGLLDFTRGAKLASSQFPVYSDRGAILENSLICYCLNANIQRGYKPFIVPFMVNENTMFTSGNFPKFRDQVYECQEDGLFLIPTSEVCLASIHRNEVLDESLLPLNYTSSSANFRREAGSYGKGERGLIRIHQFNKVEMFKFTRPEESEQEFENLVRDAELLVEGLGLHYRTTLLATRDISQQSAKTCDIEVWIPTQSRYYEVSSVSNCTDYQARRGNIRYKPSSGGKPSFVHTLNGSGLATPRLFISLIENYQREDGSIAIPQALHRYTGFQEIK